MKAWLIINAVKMILNYLLPQYDWKKLVEWVSQVDQQHDNSFAKKGAVYRQVKGLIGENESSSKINLIVELGVYLYKTLR